MFGGLQKQSLIDYPQKLSCVLFTSGCNFICPYCHNPDLVRNRQGISPRLKPERIYHFLEKRKDFLDGVVISGGEPTLHKDLPEVCRKIKDMGYPIKLDTNGSRPEIISWLIRHGLVDYIAMDIKTDPHAYPRDISPTIGSEKICRSIDIIMTCGHPYEFRTTCVQPFVNAGVIDKIVRKIQGATCFALQQFKDENVLRPDFFKNLPPPYSHTDLERFQAMAAPWVQTCIVR